MLDETTDLLLRFLANRYHPSSVQRPVKFYEFADNAVTEEGEYLLGKRKSEGGHSVESNRRTLCREVYSKYSKRAKRGTSLNVLPLYSPFLPTGPLKLSEDLVNILNNSSALTPPNTPPRSSPPRHKQQSTPPRRQHHISTSPPSSPIMANNNKVKVDAYAASYQNRLDALNVRLLCFGEGGHNCDDGIVSWTTTETKKQSDNCYHNTGSVLLPLPCREWARHVNPTIFGHGYDNGQGKGISWTSVAYDPALVSCLYSLCAYLMFIYKQISNPTTLSILFTIN